MVKKESLLKQINVLLSDTWLCAGVLVRSKFKRTENPVPVADRSSSRLKTLRFLNDFVNFKLVAPCFLFLVLSGCFVFCFLRRGQGRAKVVQAGRTSKRDLF